MAPLMPHSLHWVATYVFGVLVAFYIGQTEERPEAHVALVAIGIPILDLLLLTGQAAFQAGVGANATRIVLAFCSFGVFYGAGSRIADGIGAARGELPSLKHALIASPGDKPYTAKEAVGCGAVLGVLFLPLTIHAALKSQISTSWAPVLSAVCVAATFTGLRAGSVVGFPIGYLGGRALFAAFDALAAATAYFRSQLALFAGFAAGWLAIAVWFGAVFLTRFREDPTSFRGVPQGADLTTFVLFSMMNMATSAYGEMVPAADGTRLIAAVQVLVGLAWMSVVFAAVVWKHERAAHPDDRESSGPPVAGR